MVGEYRRQVRQQVSDVAIPSAGATDGVAAGLETLGRGAAAADQVQQQAREEIDASEYRIKVEERRRNDAAATSVWSGNLADGEVALQSTLTGIRDQSQAGASGHMDQVGDTIGQWVNDRLAAIPQDVSPEVRMRLAEVAQKTAARYRSEEFGWATQQRYQYQGDQAEKMGAGVDADMYAGFTGVKLDANFAKIDALTAGLDMPGNASATINEKLKRSAIENALTGMQDRGEDGPLAALLQSPIVGQYLDEAARSRYSRAVDTIGRARQAEADRALADAQARTRDAINALKIRMEAGDIPSASEFQAAAAAGQASGLPIDDMTRLGVMATQSDTARAYVGPGWDAGKRRRALDAYQGKVEAGTATTTDRIAATTLGQIVDKDERDQAQRLSALVAQGVPGRVQALASIQGDAETRFNVAEKLQPGWGVLANLNPIQQKSAIEGAEVRKQRGKDDFGKEAEIRRDFGGFVGAALGSHHGDIMETAWNIYAANRNARGLTGYDANEFRTSIRLATGARQRGNGGPLVGGVNFVRGKPVQLPDFLTAGEFDAALSRLSFAAAEYDDGSKASKADVLAQLRPDYVGPDEKGRDRYRFVDARGRELKKQGGGTFIATFARP